MSPSDPSASNSYSELERLSAVETLKALAEPDQVSLADLVEFLESRDMWTQFAKITLADLRNAFGPSAEETGKKKKKSLLADELGTSSDGPAKKKDKAPPTDGGIPTEEVAAQVLPFVEGNGEVTFDDLVEYTRLDKKVLRHHLGVLVKEERLDCVGKGRNAVYSTMG